MGGMWTKQQRARQARFERQRYPTNLTDAEWERIRPFCPGPPGAGANPP